MISAFLTTAAIAAPVANVVINARNPAEAQVQAAQVRLDALVVKGCNVLVTPISATCAAALAEGGANPVADLGCFAGVVATMSSPPAACAGC
ncbi:hypothetical protein N0V90_013088 [Kalmusia sp. IMI 367209]|nr:hypothetical protein N0V90_013088 [Kalmusia sp. IMI 367209]